MSVVRKESDRNKVLQEKCQAMLTNMLRDEDNKYCVDCDAKGPRWASWNLGVFLCIRCAGIHRNLGVHISRVKSVNLDEWKPEQVVSLQQMGNSRARAVYEAQLPDEFKRPQADAQLESFVRAKYEQKKYVAREWVQPPLPKVNWDREIDEEMEKQKRKKKGLGSISSPSTIDVKKPVNMKSTPIPAPLRKPTTNSSSPKSSLRGINVSVTAVDTVSSDLLGLSSPIGNPAENDVKKNNGAADHSNDVFTCFLSGPPPPSSTTTSNAGIETKTNANSIPKPKLNENPIQSSLAQEEQDFFNQIPTEKEKAKMTKDSIMALYANPPTINQFNANFNTTTGAGTNQFVSTMTSMPITGFGNGPIQFSTGHPTQYAMQPNSFNQMSVQQQSAQQQHTSIGAFASFPQQQQQPQTIGGAFTAMQPFAQHQSNPSTSLPPTTSNNLNGINNTNLNQPFGNLSLGNVWQ